MIELREFIAQIAARKVELGLGSSSVDTEALRNKGGSRTPEKRALLRRVQRRAKIAKVKAVISYY